MKKLVLSLLFASFIFSFGCKDDDDNNPIGPSSPSATSYGPEAIRQWSEFCYRMVKADTVGPAPASRIYGYMGVATYEAVVHGDDSRVSLAGQLFDLNSLPMPESAEYHWPTVMNATSALMMQAMFATGPHQSTRDSITAFENYWNGILSGTVEHSVFTRSQTYGQALGTALATWANSDGYTQNHNCTTWIPPVGNQYWVPTPPAFKPAHEPCWGSLRTFVLERSGADFECEPPPPHTFSTDTASQFYQDAMEVVTTQANETAEDSIIAAFWADVPGSTGAPAGHWCAISGNLCDQYDMNLAEAAECYARTGIAMHDAFIECWKAKYQYSVIRPVTYINRYIDSTWVPSWPTPNFPEYTSGHSSCSGACSRALEGMLGTSCAFTDHTHDNRGFAPRPYATLADAAEEAALSRLLGGIHYRDGNNQGLYTGRCIGDKVNALTFRATS